MPAHVLTSFLRSLSRHRVHAALNIGGLAIGIAVFVVLALYVRFETGYERWLPGSRNAYIVETRWSMAGMPMQSYPYSMGGLLEQMREDFPGTVGTRIYQIGGSVIRSGVGTKEDFAQVDPTFLDVLPLPILRGRAGAATLADPTALLLNATAAAKYFPGVDPIGQALTINVDGTTARYHVVAVFADLPKATELPAMSMIAALPRKVPSQFWYHWGSSSLFTYLRFDDRARVEAMRAGMKAFIDRRGRKDMGAHASNDIGLELLPMRDLHLQAPAKRITVTTLGIVGLLALAIAVVNYINLETARAGLRAREVAMRKVLGANRRALVVQFMGEAVTTVALATLIGLALVEVALPAVNAAGGMTLAMPYVEIVPAAILFAIVVGGLAGVYPALMLSAFPAAAVLASARAPGGGRAGTRVREGLVIVQFALVIALVIGTLVLVGQTRHVRTTDLGFRREGLLELRSIDDATLDEGRQQTILAAIRATPGVLAAGIGDMAVGDKSNNNATNIVLPGRPGDGPSLKEVVVGPDFFHAYDVRPVAGRLFDAAHALDDAKGREWAEPRNIVINAAAVPVLGFRSAADAIGRTVGGGGPRTIVGVVPDLRYFSPREAVSPTFYDYVSTIPSMAQFASIRFAGDPHVFIDRLRATWLRVAPEVPFDAKLATTALGEYYADDDHATNLFAIGAVLAVAIGCIGLWGLASFNTARRVKEIGIRKTLGASTGDVVRLLVGQFLRPVLLANLIAWPLAFVALRKWLAGFDDRIALSPFYFLAASLLALGIAAATVFTQSLRAARRTPAWALRHE